MTCSFPGISSTTAQMIYKISQSEERTLAKLFFSTTTLTHPTTLRGQVRWIWRKKMIQTLETYMMSNNVLKWMMFEERTMSEKWRSVLNWNKFVELINRKFFFFWQKVRNCLDFCSKAWWKRRKNARREKIHRSKPIQNMRTYYTLQHNSN